MARLVKAGILLFLLVVPAFVFIFLKVFGRNQFTLQTFFPVIDAKTGQIETRPADRSGWGKGARDTVFYTLPRIVGTLPDKKPFSTSDLNGKLYVASFFGLNCDSTCGQVAGQLNRVQDIFIQKPDIMLVSFVDTDSVARQVMTANDVQPEKWLIAKPDSLETAFLGEQYYRIKQRPMTGRKNETFTLYEGLVLIDHEGHIRGFYNGTDKADVDRLVLEVRVLQDIYSHQ
ncbi:SCO family protein [Larkinella humicola]|uniref:SCO family protein n=1 Tax=Larkinella humicola TaxID=2607654 RepID=A0A5N1JG91_9BACT|nr:SCO family protein [Larkinella humicola]KAA9353829.1 SCO family protein [Larkinella humicola]